MVAGKHLILAVLLLLLFGACETGRRSPVGFRLPDNGDVERGKTAFVELQCVNCHTVQGMDLPAPPEGATVVALGGVVREIRTDGYMVTSIIHPSHRLARQARVDIAVEGESRMPDFARTMTVRQMIDITAFLQETYRFEPPPGPIY